MAAQEDYSVKSAFAKPIDGHADLAPASAGKRKTTKEKDEERGIIHYWRPLRWQTDKAARAYYFKFHFFGQMLSKEPTLFFHWRRPGNWSYLCSAESFFTLSVNSPIF